MVNNKFIGEESIGREVDRLWGDLANKRNNNYLAGKAYAYLPDIYFIADPSREKCCCGPWRVVVDIQLISLNIASKAPLMTNWISIYEVGCPIKLLHPKRPFKGPYNLIAERI